MKSRVEKELNTFAAVEIMLNVWRMSLIVERELYERVCLPTVMLGVENWV